MHCVSFNLYTKSVKFHNHMPKYQFAYNVNSASFIFVIYQRLFLETRKKPLLGKDCSLEFKSISSPPRKKHSVCIRPIKTIAEGTLFHFS